MRRLTLTCLCVALTAAYAPGAMAQMVNNPFVSSAQAPGAVPAPPVFPGGTLPKAQLLKKGDQPPPIPPGVNPGGASAMVFGAMNGPKPVAGYHPTAEHQGNPKGLAPAVEPTPGAYKGVNIMDAKPGQTVTAPALPQFPTMPPVPSLNPVVPMGQFTQQSQEFSDHIDKSALEKETQPVQTMKFTAEVGKTYRLVMSSVTPNLLISPFEHPKLIMSSANAVHFVAHGNSLVVTVAPGTAVGGYLTGESATDPLIALVFEPKNLPPQNYRLDVDGFIEKTKQTPAAESAAQVQGSSTQYTQRVVQLIETTLSGHIPEGFGPVSKRHWPLGRNQAGLVVEPAEVLSSGEEILDVLTVTNTTVAPVSLEENDFYRRGVEGVALTAHAPIHPGQTVRVAILRKASQSDASDTLMSVSHP